jgi:hypothetical protein
MSSGPSIVLSAFLPLYRNKGEQIGNPRIAKRLPAGKNGYLWLPAMWMEENRPLHPRAANRSEAVYAGPRKLLRPQPNRRSNLGKNCF